MATSIVRSPPKPLSRMSFTAASRSRLRVASLRSAWVLRGTTFGSTDRSRRERNLCREFGVPRPVSRKPAGLASSVFYTEVFIHQFHDIGFQSHGARHPRRLAAGHIECTEVPGALDDIAGQHPFLGERGL